MSEAYNKNMPGYKCEKENKYKLNPEIHNISGLSNYTSYSKEVLLFKQIKNNDVKRIIYPILQDLLIGCDFNIENNLTELIKKEKHHKSILLSKNCIIFE